MDLVAEGILLAADASESDRITDNPRIQRIKVGDRYRLDSSGAFALDLIGEYIQTADSYNPVLLR